MALTDAQLAQAIRVGPDYDALDGSQQRIIARLNLASRAFVRAHTDLAPEAIEDEAVIRFAGYLYDAPSLTRTGVAWRESGAMHLVDPWKVRGVILVQDDDASSASASASGEAVDDLQEQLAALRLRIARIEGPRPYTGRVYSARLPDADATLADIRQLHFLSPVDFHSLYADDGADLDLAAGPADGSFWIFAVPGVEGALVELNTVGGVLQQNVRRLLEPALDAEQVGLAIGGHLHYVYKSIDLQGAFSFVYQPRKSAET